MARKSNKTPAVNILEIGYATVREAFNDVLDLCTEKLNKADFTLGHEILGTEIFDDDTPGLCEMLSDTALYSRKGRPGARSRARRAIDRIAPKLPVKRDPLKSLIAARLPKAVFSLFAIEEPHAQGGVAARDLLDDRRAVHIMDNSLASWASRRDEAVIAGRFVDLGPWYVGFGIVRSMRKSEVLAIRLALSHEGDLETKRDNLHELIYPAVLHNEDLVMTALEPMIIAFADAVDRDMIDMEEIAANLVSFIDDL